MPDADSGIRRGEFYERGSIVKHVPTLTKVPEVLMSLPWQKISEYAHEHYTQISDGDRLLVAVPFYESVDGKFTDEWRYDIATIKISFGDCRISSVVIGNEYDFDCEFSDCDWFVKL
jgi:acyl transferase domain-containing protein